MSANQGNDVAMFEYGIHLLNTKKCNKEAARYLQLSADNGNVDGMQAYAMMLDNGVGISVNKKEASAAADKGNTDAMYEYGIKILDDNLIPDSKKEAARYIKMAADKGNENAIHFYNENTEIFNENDSFCNIY